MGLLAAGPFLSHAGLPYATDAELHVIRTAELGYSLRAGNLYPRWAPNFYHGHGYPIFNYYAPLTYHLGVWLAGFQPENAVSGARVLFILSHILGAIGAYLLGRDFGGEGGGLLGAAAFTFAPYVLVINPHLRGDLPEVFAVVLIPWALWCWERLWFRGGRLAFVGAILFAALTLLSHNLTGLTLMILLMLLSAWHWLCSKAPTAFHWPLLAGVLIMLLTAYFWLPFVAERQFIQLDVAGEGHYDFRRHFVLLTELLAPLPAQDWRDTVIQAPMGIGPLVPLLAILGSTAVMLRQTFSPKSVSRRMLFYTLSAAAMFWLITSSSRWLWELIPGMHYYQFPWRFLGPLAALVVPPVAGCGRLFAHEKYRAGATALLLAGLVIAGLPGLYPLPWEDTWPPITPQKIIAMELEGRWRGTTSTNDFVPQTVEMIPGPQPSVIASYANPPVDRVNRYTLPADATVEVLPDVPWRQRFRVDTPQAFLLRLYLFDFPGWVATINGELAPIKIAHPEGFITVEVPEGEHEVLLSFEDTLPRAAGWWIAAGGVILLGVAVLRLPSAEPAAESASRAESLTLHYAALVVIGLVLFKGLVLDHVTWAHYTSPPGEARAATRAQFASFGEEIALLGFDLSDEQLRPGQTLKVTLYWAAERPMTQTYQSFVHLVYPEGRVWAQSDHLNPGGFPTNLWPTDRYVRDRHRLTLPDNLPPGEYTLSVGVYTLQDQRRLPVIVADFGARPDNLILSESVTLREPRARR